MAEFLIERAIDESFCSLNCVIDVYRSLFANNALNLIKVLLDQVAHGNMRIVGCLTLVDFIRVQV